MLMNQNLLQKTQEWMQLERKTIEQRKLAEEFYETQLMELIEEDFIERNRDSVFEKVDFLVSSVGTSYEPIILNIKLFQPRKILFLYTDKSETVLGKIVEYCDLKPTQYEKSRVSETNPLDIYEEIKRCYLKWNRPARMYIDFTGGTKAMSAAAAMAGAMIDVQLVYVGSNDYLADFRKPNPGSELLFYVTNPLAVFGDLEIEKAYALFEKHNYAGAQERLGQLKESIPDPNIRQQLNFVYLLARAYEEWDALEFCSAYEYMKKLNEELRRDRILHRAFLLMDLSETLEKQEEILSHLQKIPELIKERNNMNVLTTKDMIIALMFTMYQNARVREEQEKYDMATLLLYRLLEMIEQRRLAVYNLYVSKMNYSNLKYDYEQHPEFAEGTPEEKIGVLKNKVANIKSKIFGQGAAPYLPDQVSLLEGFILLLALSDPIMGRADKNGLNKLKQIRAMVFLRNNSIFAHGLGPVGRNDYERFKNFVIGFFEEFCKVEGVDFAEYSRDIRWINPKESKNSYQK